jgi:predicted RNA-binding Zn-ribbon protein involved in translation (DUF1610 family)
MAIEDRIECHSCGRAIVPQLWVDAKNRMEHPTVRHLCPLCGATLRVSGGGISRGGWTLLVVSISLIVLALVVALVLPRS